MAFGGSFKEDHPYATGLLLIVVAGFGVAGSVTGQLAAMLAALWVPTVLVANTDPGTGGSSGASGSGGPSVTLGGPSVASTTPSTTTPATTAAPPLQGTNAAGVGQA